METATTTQRTQPQQGVSSFAKSLFLGEIHEDLVFPYPQPGDDERRRIRDLVLSCREFGAHYDQRAVEERGWIAAEWGTSENNRKAKFYHLTSAGERQLTNEAAAFDVGDRRFVQSTLHGEIRFPTFAAQEFWLTTHLVHTFGDTAPPQRWSYLGGAGTITTLPLLTLGGDRLLYVESNYYVPLQRFDLPILGTPSLTLRHIIGSAGVGKLPSFEQNLGLRVALSFARFDAVVDPARRSWEFGFGLSMAR